MLVFSRSPGQTVCIGNTVKLTINNRGGVCLEMGNNITVEVIPQNAENDCKVYIDAPRHIPVDRLEIRNKKNRQA